MSVVGWIPGSFFFLVSPSLSRVPLLARFFSVVGVVVDGDESTSAGQCGVIAITLWNCAESFLCVCVGVFFVQNSPMELGRPAIKDNATVGAREGE